MEIPGSEETANETPSHSEIGPRGVAPSLFAGACTKPAPKAPLPCVVEVAPVEQKDIPIYGE
jgi:hypothetical protein